MLDFFSLVLPTLSLYCIWKHNLLLLLSF